MNKKERLDNTISIVKKILENNNETDSESYKKILKLEKKQITIHKKI